MGTYYRLNSLIEDDSVSISQRSHKEFDFNCGMRIPSAIADPILFEVDGAIGGRRWPSLFMPEMVFVEEFVHAFLDTGVSNIEIYNARILDPVSHVEHLEYRVINIVGMCACADLAHSEYDQLDETLYAFDRLVLDVGRCAGAMCFRLYEAPSMVLVHRSVVSRIDPLRFRDLVFSPVEDSR